MKSKFTILIISLLSCLIKKSKFHLYPHSENFVFRVLFFIAFPEFGIWIDSAKTSGQIVEFNQIKSSKLIHNQLKPAQYP